LREELKKIKKEGYIWNSPEDALDQFVDKLLGEALNPKEE